MSRAGESDAENDLIKAVQSRLQKLAARMTRGFPNIRSLADTDDVFQNSVMRLLSTLRNIQPRTTRDFFNLAAVHIRRELIDLAHRAKGKATVSLNLVGSTDSPAPHEPAAPEVEDMDEWVEFHEAIDQLPMELREVVSLVVYHGLKQVQVAELLHVNVRTIRRRWLAACGRIQKLAELGSESE